VWSVGLCLSSGCGLLVCVSQQWVWSVGLCLSGVVCWFVSLMSGCGPFDCVSGVGVVCWFVSQQWVWSVGLCLNSGCGLFDCVYHRSGCGLLVSFFALSSS